MAGCSVWSDLPADIIECLPITGHMTVHRQGAQEQSVVEFLCASLRAQDVELLEHDIVVVNARVASYFEGGWVHLGSVRPSPQARLIGRIRGKDPREVHLALCARRNRRSLPQEACSASPKRWRTLAGRSRGLVPDCANTASANRLYDHVLLPPPDPLETAAWIRAGLEETYGSRMAVIIAGGIHQMDSRNAPLGASGLDPTSNATIESVAAIACLIMRQTAELTPAVVVRGIEYLEESPGFPTHAKHGCADSRPSHREDLRSLTS